MPFRRNVVECRGGEQESSRIRFDKLLVHRGAGSRKEIHKMFKDGLVSLYDPETDKMQVAAKNAFKLKIPWESSPVVDGIDYPPPPLLYLYNKPLGDEEGDSITDQLGPVQPFDADTKGLMIFSRDATITEKLTHPKYQIQYEYIAEVDNDIDEDSLREKVAGGVEIKGPLNVTADVVRIEGQHVRLVIMDHRINRLRRMLVEAGHPVISLQVVRIGEFRLDDFDLAEGEGMEVDGDLLNYAMGLKSLQPSEEWMAAHKRKPGPRPRNTTRSNDAARTEDYDPFDSYDPNELDEHLVASLADCMGLPEKIVRRSLKAHPKSHLSAVEELEDIAKDLG